MDSLKYAECIKHICRADIEELVELTHCGYTEPLVDADNLAGHRIYVDAVLVQIIPPDEYRNIEVYDVDELR